MKTSQKNSTCLRQKGADAVSLVVLVQPKASRNRVAGEHGGALKISVTAPPVDGKANVAVGEFLAKLFQVPKSAVTLQSGGQSRTKRFHIAGIALEAATKIVRQQTTGA